MGDQWQRLGSEIFKNNFISTWNHVWNETKVQKPRDLDCDLGLGQGHIGMHNTYQHAQSYDCSLMHYRNKAIWMSWNIDIPRSLNSRDSFRTRKFENWALTSCRSGPALSRPTISFELHAKMAEEIDLEMCSFHKFSEVQKLRDLDLGSGQGHFSIHNTRRTDSVPNHVTVASHTIEIWPFEFREISIFGWRSLNSRDSFARRKLKNRTLLGYSPCPILSPPTISFELHAKTTEEIDVETKSAIFTTTEAPWPWPCAYVVELYPHTKLDRNQKSVYRWTDGHTWVPIY